MPKFPEMTSTLIYLSMDEQCTKQYRNTVEVHNMLWQSGSAQSVVDSAINILIIFFFSHTCRRKLLITEQKYCNRSSSVHALHIRGCVIGKRASASSVRHSTHTLLPPIRLKNAITPLLNKV